MVFCVIVLLLVWLPTFAAEVNVSQTFVVGLRGYFDASERLAIVSGALPGYRYLWQRVPRPTFAPFSDFEVIELADCDAESALRLLRNNDQINYAVPDAKIQRRLQSFDEDSPRKRHIAQNQNAHSNVSSGAADSRLFGRQRQPWRSATRQISRLVRADVLWSMGFRGQGVRVGIFDTGLSKNHPHFVNVREYTGWTNEKTTNDGLGHGTFVAGIIGSRKECLGIAPEAELHIYKVFTDNQVSYTSWFLDAFNYALMRGLDVVNLSIGGPDFMDHPFMEKVWELTSNGVVLVSAIGNDGPVYGTLNNPADHLDVVGVGGIDYNDRIAKFSSRGMTTWELPYGYGRAKPDIVTYGVSLHASAPRGGCRTLSGTSVASPVVAGAVALLLSSAKDKSSVNPGVVKQVLCSGGQKLRSTAANMFEQGCGKLDLVKAYRHLDSYTPHASFFPSYVDFSECPYMWPYCDQPLFTSGMPTIVNVSIINGMGVYGKVVKPPEWHYYTAENGQLLRVSFDYSPTLWPWSGWLAVFLTVIEEARNFEGSASGEVRLTVESSLHSGKMVQSQVILPVRAKIVPTPPRGRRIVWDQFHNLRYPPGYFPRDDLKAKKDPLDWNGDHIHTNFKEMYTYLRNAGYFVEVLGYPYTCLDASQYSALLVVDPEDYWFPSERRKLEADVANLGLNLVVFADWFNTSVIHKIRFYDDVTKRMWYPETGGSNLVALNYLLRPWNISFSGLVLEGDFNLSGKKMVYASGTTIWSNRTDLLLLRQQLKNQGEDVLTGESRMEQDAVIMAVTPFKQNSGLVAAYGDSNCLDSAHLRRDCFWLLEDILQYAIDGTLSATLQRSFDSGNRKANQNRDHVLDMASLQGKHTKYSKVVDGVTDSGRLRFKTIPKCPHRRWAEGIPIANKTFDDFWREINEKRNDSSEKTLPETNAVLPWFLETDPGIGNVGHPYNRESARALMQSLFYNMGTVVDWLGSVLLWFLCLVFLWLALRWVCRRPAFFIRGFSRVLPIGRYRSGSHRGMFNTENA